MPLAGFRKSGVVAAERDNAASARARSFPAPGPASAAPDHHTHELARRRHNQHRSVLRPVKKGNRRPRCMDSESVNTWSRSPSCPPQFRRVCRGRRSYRSRAACTALVIRAKVSSSRWPTCSPIHAL